MKEYRIGQVILAAELVDANKLNTAVNYAASKALPVGHVMKLLKYISEDELADSLTAQKMLRDGLPLEIGIRLLKRCRTENIRIRDAFRAEFPQTHLARTAGSSNNLPSQSSSTQPDWLKTGHSLFREGKWQRSEEAFQRHKDECEGKYGGKSLQYGEALSALADLYIATERFSDAEQLYLKILEIRQLCLGTESPFIDQILEDLADIYWISNDQNRAIHFYRMSVDNRAKRLPSEIDRFVSLLRKIHPHFLEAESQRTRGKTGEILVKMGLVNEQNVSDALKRSRAREVPIGTELSSQSNVDKSVLSSVLNMQSLVSQRRISEFVAANCLKAALQLGRTFEEFIKQSNLLGIIGEDCLEMLELQESLVSLEQELGPKNSKVAHAATRLADMHSSRGNEVNAELLYRRVLCIWANSSEDECLKWTFECKQKLADLYLNLGKWLEAEPLLLDCLSLNQKLDRSADADFRLLISMAKLKYGQADEQASASILRSAVSIMDKVSSLPLIPVSLLTKINSTLESMGLEEERQRLTQKQIQIRESQKLPVEKEIQT